METVASIATAARNAVFGEPKEEPISGVRGDVSKGEPYDAGNIEHIEQPRSNGAAIHSEADTKNAETTSLPLHTKHTDTTATKANLPSEADLKPNYTPPEPSPPFSSHSPPSNPATTDTSTTTTTTTAAQPASLDGPHDHHGNDTTKSQTDTRPPSSSSSNPLTDPSTAKAARTDVTETNPLDLTSKTATTTTAAAASDKDDEVKIDGPGPRPLADVAREHGGDAGKSNSSLGGGASPQVGGSGAPAPESTGGQDHSQDRGELYVRSSGLRADGGDFDASAPGAGREADRLLEAKGVHREDGKHDASGGKHHGLMGGLGHHGQKQQHHHQLPTQPPHQSSPPQQQQLHRHESPLHQEQHESPVQLEHHEEGDEHAAGGKHKTSLKDKIKAKLHKS